MRGIGKGQIELTVSDNGVGLREDLDFRKTESLGLQLVTTLAENQLQGKIELDRNAGTKFKITFETGNKGTPDNAETAVSAELLEAGKSIL
jgi:two-component sensor histidine kinase